MQIGTKIIHLSSVDSTNNYIAKRILVDNLPSGTVILADEQTNGRGQRGKIWQSESGNNLTFSIYLSNVNLSVDRQFDLNIWVSVALCRALTKIGLTPSIKWPNDIYIESNKIAGILIENSLSNTGIKHSIVGIGLNINQVNFDCINATSLKIELGEWRNVQEVLFQIIEQFNHADMNEIKGLKQEYLNQLYLLNECAKFEDKDGPFDGQIIGVTESGKLQVEKNGFVKDYYLQEISLIN